MARDLDLNIHVDSDNRGLDDTARGLDKVSGSADDASTSFKKLDNESGHVDANISRLKSHIHELTQEINRTGNTSLFKDLNNDKSSLRKFENLKKELTPQSLHLGQHIGDEMNKGIISSMGGLGANLRGALIPAAIGLVAIMSPIIGASIAGAVTGAVGVGGLAGGIFAAAQDPQVKSAAHHFGESISAEFAASGKSFVKPVMDSLDILKKGFGDLHLDQVFERAAPFLTEFAHGISGLVTQMMPGLNRAFAQLGPVMAVMGKELPELGAAFGDMIGDMAESKGAVEGLHFVFEFLEATLRVTGTTVAWLSDRFHELVGAGEGFTGFMRDVLSAAPGVGEALSSPFEKMNHHLQEIMGIAPQVSAIFADIPGRFSSTADAADGFTSSVSHMTMTVQQLTDALNKLFDVQMSQDQALLAIQRDTLSFTAAVKDSGATLNTHTEAGIHNREMILQLVQDYEKQRQAAIKSGESTASATRKFDDQIGTLAGLMSKLGFTKGQIDSLLGSYKRLHDAPDIRKEIRFNVSVSGQTGALALLGNSGKIAAFADGGWVQGPPGAPQLAVVHGGEYVLSRDMLKGVASAPAGAAAGGGSVRTAPIIAPAGTLEAALIGALQKFVRDNYGGDVVAAFGT